MTERLRADRLLVDRGFFESRAKAQDAIAAGLVTADGAVVRKPSEGVPAKAVIVAEPAHPWVSRGGVKLAHALDHFGLDPADRVCLDAGASTGGFTEVLLARGARSVTAVDVGHRQLHAKVAADRRVRSLEGRDVRSLTPADLPEPVSLVVMDVSFIPLAAALPPVLALAAPGAAAVILIKPQFEAGRAHIGKNGIVKDEAVHAEVCARAETLVAEHGWTVRGVIPSPIAGGEGNREFLLVADKPC